MRNADETELTTTREHEMPPANMASTADNILAIMGFLKGAPQGSSIPVYETKDQQWYRLELNPQGQLVIVMELTTGATAKKLLEIKSRNFLFDKSILQQAEARAQEPDETAINNATLARNLKIIIEWMEQQAKHAAKKPKEETDGEIDVQKRAQELAKYLSARGRKLEIDIRNGDTIVFEYFPLGLAGLDLNAFNNMVRATGSTIVRSRRGNVYTATISAEQFAHYLVNNLAKELIKELLLRQIQNKKLSYFSFRVGKIEKDRMTITLQLKIDTEQRSNTLEITIIQGLEEVL